MVAVWIMWQGMGKCVTMPDAMPSVSPRHWQQSGLAWLWVAVLVLLLDQLTKWAALVYLAPYQPVALLPHFNLMLAFNPGAAFSFLGDAGGWQRWLFVGLALVVSAVLIVWMWRNAREQRWLNLGLALVLGGALGNVIDRMMTGKVVDFLDFYWGVWHYPTFNVADMGITVGAGLLLLDAWQHRKDSE